ncbi:hypothetical protein BT094_11755 [Corynebacterium diphtheriae]|nr:hypothetical protein BT094_11755 [Corynebacterium diphtheriae]
MYKLQGVTRVAAKDVLEERAATADHRWFGTFVTYWAAGQWVKHLDSGLFLVVVLVGLVFLTCLLWTTIIHE